MTKKYRNLARLLEKYRLVLASGSPRRVHLLKEAGIDFRQIIPDIWEDDSRHEDPYELATFLAVEKSRAVREKLAEDEVALGCDTIVVLGKRILGKPVSEKEAFEMLSELSGRMHTVCSAVALLSRTGEAVSGYELSDVYFRNVSASDIRQYIKTGEPLDKAGSYGIQERGVFLVDRVVGNIDNVIGLPRTLLNSLAGRMA
ncbi:MAG: septum formation protein Maf [Candidatus Zixiibacteriota bacterium]|nr:MAG: septum formation protein Maf [candidate division Zixibacteria bacterium]